MTVLVLTLLLIHTVFDLPTNGKFVNTQPEFSLQSYRAIYFLPAWPSTSIETSSESQKLKSQLFSGQLSATCNCTAPGDGYCTQPRLNSASVM